MLAFLRMVHTVSERKLRLFAVACCRRIWHLLADAGDRRAVEAAERYADGRAAPDELVDPWPLGLPRPASPDLDWAAFKAAGAAHLAARLTAAREIESRGHHLMGDAAYYVAGAVAWQLAGVARSAAAAASWAAAWN